jgi:hypothetical protein
MRGLLLVGAIAIFASGCQELRQHQAKVDDAECSSYGLPYGSDAYAQCRMIMSQRRQDGINRGFATLAAAASPPQPVQTTCNRTIMGYNCTTW